MDNYFKYFVLLLYIASSSVYCQHIRRRYTDDNGEVKYIRTIESTQEQINTNRYIRAVASWGEWASHESCAATCGPGIMTLTRDCSTGTVSDCEAQGGRFWQVVECNSNPCPYEWTPWSRATACSESCGEAGYYEMVRNCSNGRISDCEADGGKYWEVLICNEGPCIVPWMEWGSWSECSVTCGFGVTVRLRNCSTGVTKDCQGNNYTLSACNAGSCPRFTTPPQTTPPPTTTPGPASWSAWHTYIKCSQTCGPGFGERVRECSTGRDEDCAIPGENPWEVFACNQGSCLTHGSWGVWGDWSTCAVTCGTGELTRSRACEYPDDQNKGNPCEGNSMQRQNCATNPCPVDGQWSQWTQFTTCSTSCDDGQKTRTRTCDFPAGVPHGDACIGPVTDTQTCVESSCRSDGKWSQWSSFSTCTKTCGGGVIFRGRTCVYEPGKPRGADCVGSDIETQDCNIDACAVNGSWTTWSSWSQCTHTCNGGKQTRSRVCLYQLGAPHGAPCVGDSTAYQDCGQAECPVDGQWSPWTPWATCSQSCGGGKQTRNRTCQYRSVNPDTPHGLPCLGDGSQQQDCRTDSCPVDATWSTWTRFGDCSVTCGSGIRTKTRVCQVDPVAPMGRNCTGLDAFSEECNANPCPVDGLLSQWKEWGVCSVTCDGGTHTRRRECVFPVNVPHGDNCTGSLVQSEVCGDTPCPTTTSTTTAPTVDGAWGNWGAFGRCSTTCGAGTHVRTRLCDFDPRYDRGENCTGTDNNSDVCDAGKCPVDGVWTDWQPWSSCSVTCGGSIQERMRTCYFPPDAPQGADCGGDSHENRTCGTGDCPVDGVLTGWSEWTACSLSCGGGTQERNRTCDFPADKPRGLDCHGDLNQTHPCNTNLCPVDGVWTDWENWSTCSATCGSGKHSRNRDCNYGSNNAPHGATCQGSVTESATCNANACPVDGIWLAWNAWSTCSVSCGDGTYTRTRACQFLDDHAPRGDDCVGANNETDSCTDGLCPVDGSWLDWSAWSDCSATCGAAATTSRTRVCDFPVGVPKGDNCTGAASETTSCNKDLCPVDGMYGEWGNWSACSETCGGGEQTRERTCQYDQTAPRGNDCVGPANDTQPCNTDNCPVDGVWSSWSNFTDCSVTCGIGTKFRIRQCEFPADTPHGNNCPGSSDEHQICNTDDCPVDGVLSEWSQWSDCSKSCEGGTQARNRSCDFPDPPTPRGNDCNETLDETQDCNTEKCPVNGLWTDWSNYTACTVTCAGGIQTRNRTCIYDDNAPHGSVCFGNLTQDNSCNEQPCPVDGTWGSWNAWHACTVTCGGGKMVRDRACDYPDGIAHGLDCVGQREDITDCNTNACPVDGVFSDWSDWTTCSSSCGDGQQFRNRRCNFPPDVPKGANCSGQFHETQTCNNGSCPVDGQWSSWSNSSTCTVSCGSGTQSRNRSCEYNSNDSNSPQGDPCPGSATETTACNTDACPVDGQWTAWSEFTACSASCGNGTSSRNRTCEYLPAGSPAGNPCPGDSTEVNNCNPDACPVDAVLSEWTAWSDCSETCGGGNQTRDRNCTWPTDVHGDDCTDPLTETQMCNTNLCAVDGIWGEWSNFSSCSETCGFGVQMRTRECVYDDNAPHGVRCPGAESSTGICKVENCPADGRWSFWLEWSVCSTTCGAGVSTRNRTCAFPWTPHGKDCEGDATENQACANTTECPVDGVLSEWSVWSACTVSCAGGTQDRSRNCTYPPDAPHGAPCTGPLQDSQACSQDACPVMTSPSTVAATTTTPDKTTTEKVTTTTAAKDTTTTTTAPAVPLTKRSCNVCLLETGEFCESAFSVQECENLDQQYCINTVDNQVNAERTIIRRCGTLKECNEGWFQKYSSNDKCMNFDEDFIFTNAFYCEYCCDSDNCNERVNPPDKYHP